MESPTYGLIVHAEERPVLALALKVFRDGLGHEEHRIAAIADEVVGELNENGDPFTVTLDAAMMKVTWSALHMLLDDTVRGQRDDREHLHALLHRLPGEHDIRAIDLDEELERRARSSVSEGG
ncbi:MAG: hypothetical protein QOF26_3116 [Baekduia sp.]|jgi:hypothetical protein|nr:hypothetical protein [Baekduia sp.]